MPGFSLKPYKILPGDDLPATDSGYWITEINDLHLRGYGALFSYPAPLLIVPPPHGWFHFWTKDSQGRVSHTENLYGVREPPRLNNRYKRLKIIQKIIESGLPLWSTIEKTQETMSLYREILEKSE